MSRPPSPSQTLSSKTILDGSNDRNVLILHASQTGTAEDLAAHLTDTFTRHRFTPTTLSFESFDNQAGFMSFPQHRLVFLLVSTTGQGALPDTSISLWKKLCKRRIPLTWLAGTRFGLFALGDSTYPKFCWAGKMVNRRLLQIGASECVQRVEGDGSGEEGIEGAFGRWTEGVRSFLRDVYPLRDGLEEIPDDVLLPPKYTVQVGDVAEGVEEHIPRPEAVRAVLKENQQVTPGEHWQDVRLLSLQLPIGYAHWDPGDTVSIQPINDPRAVDSLLTLQSWQPIADAPLSITPLPAFLPSGQPITLRQLITHHLSLTSIPSRRFFALAAHLTADENHAERLAEFADPQWIEELYDYTSRPRRTTLEVLHEFHTVKIPLPYLLELIPPLRPRHFSIASADNGTGQLQLLVALVRYKTVIKTPRWGAVSRYLAGLTGGESVGLVFSKGGWKVDTHTPVLMIAPGTGVAPMRALIQSRIAAASEGQVRGTLVFGCRNKSADYFFADEWEWARGLEVYAAFSRDQKVKRYVQTVLRERGKEVWKLLSGGDTKGENGEKKKEGATVFICGSSGRMPTAVREALIEVAGKWGSMRREEAKAWLEGLEKGGKYLQETW